SQRVDWIICVGFNTLEDTSEDLQRSSPVKGKRLLHLTGIGTPAVFTSKLLNSFVRYSFVHLLLARTVEYRPNEFKNFEAISGFPTAGGVVRAPANPPAHPDRAVGKRAGHLLSGRAAPSRSREPS